jgi:hypothetical protein
MSRILRAVAGAALVVLAPAIAVGASQGERPADARPPQFGPLAPKQVGKIQGLGRAVLAARDGYIPDAGHLALRQELQQLRQELEAAEMALAALPRLKLSASRVLTVGTQPVFHLEPSASWYQLEIDAQGRASQRVPAAASSPKALAGLPVAEAGKQERAERFAALRTRIGQLRQRVRNTSGEGQFRAGLSFDSARMKAKVAEIDEELTRLLDSASPQSAGQVPALRKRLAIRNISEELNSQRAGSPAADAEPAPTFQTITRHR